MSNKRIKDLTLLSDEGLSVSSSTEIAVDYSGYGEAYKIRMDDIVHYVQMAQMAHQVLMD